jgi:hypothetical protein
MPSWFDPADSPTNAAILERYRLMRKVDVGWRLLRYRNAPLLFTLAETVFADEMQVDYAVVERAVMELLPYWRDDDAEEGEAPPDRDWFLDGESRQRASRCISEWIESGWFHEADARLTMASATRVCCNFMKGLERGDLLLSDSSLSTLFGLLKEFAFELDEDVEAKVKHCEERSSEWLERARRIRDEEVAVQMDALTFRNRFLEIEQYIAMMDTNIEIHNDNLLKWREEFRRMIFDPEGDDNATVRSFYDKADELRDSPEGRNFAGFLELMRETDRHAAHRRCLQDIVQSRKAADAARLDDRLPAKMEDASTMFDRLLGKAGKVNASQGQLYASAVDWLTSRQYAEDQRLLRLVRALLDKAGRIDDASDRATRRIDCRGLDIPWHPIRFENPVAFTFATPKQVRPVEIRERTNDDAITAEELLRLGGVDYDRVMGALTDALDASPETTLAGLLAAIRFERFEEMLYVMKIGFDAGEYLEGIEDRVDVAFADGVLRNVRCPRVLLRKGLLPGNVRETYHE